MSQTSGFIYLEGGGWGAMTAGFTYLVGERVRLTCGCDDEAQEQDDVQKSLKLTKSQKSLGH